MVWVLSNLRGWEARCEVLGGATREGWSRRGLAGRDRLDGWMGEGLGVLVLEVGGGR